MTQSNEPQIVTFANIKGGVGKTTAVVNIAYLLAQEFGQRVLVIDADDQGNATKALGVRDLFDRKSQTLWAALNEKAGYRKVMITSPYSGIAVVPASKELKGVQLAFGQSARGLKMIKRFLKGVGRDFDFVLIDTKPQINILLQAALVASNGYIVPSFPESDSYDGFLDLLTECEEIYEEINEDLSCLGILFTNVKKSPAHEAYIEFIKKHLRNARVPFFRTVVRHSNAIATGSLHNRPAVALSSTRNTFDDYYDVTKQLVRATKNTQKLQRPDLDRLGLDGGDSEDMLPLVAVTQESQTEIRF